MDWGKKWFVDFNAGKTQLGWFDRSDNTGAIDVKMDGSVLEEKSFFKMLGLTFSSKLDWGSYIIVIAKTASKTIRALIRSMKFLSPEVTLYLYKSTICPCMEYLFYRYYFGRCSSELAELVPLILEGDLLVILIDCMIFLSLFLDVTRMSMSTVSFLAQLGCGTFCL